MDNDVLQKLRKLQKLLLPQERTHYNALIRLRHQALFCGDPANRSTECIIDSGVLPQTISTQPIEPMLRGEQTITF
jgi:hypothetical protein